MEYTNEAPKRFDLTKILDRIKLVMTEPVTCWTKIQSDPITTKELTFQFILPLVAIGVVLAFISLALIGMYVPGVGMVRLSFMGTFFSKLVEIPIRIAAIYAAAVVIDKLAIQFGGSTDVHKAFSLVTHSMIPGLLAALTVVLPWVSALFAIGLGIYGIYIYHHGVPHMVTIAPEKHLTFTVVSILSIVLVNIFLGLIVYIITPTAQLAKAPVINLESLNEEIQNLKKNLGESGKK